MGLGILISGCSLIILCSFVCFVGVCLALSLGPAFNAVVQTSFGEKLGSSARKMLNMRHRNYVLLTYGDGPQGV